MSRSTRKYSDDVPDEVIERVRVASLRLPDAYEEVPSVGVRWMVRNKTFAQVLGVENGSDHPTVTLVFRSSGEDLEMLRNLGPPFFAVPWGHGAVAMEIGPDTDWDEVGELVTESFCVQAPKKLVALVDRPDPDT